MNSSRIIKLSRGQCAIVNTRDFTELSQWKWACQKDMSGALRAYRRGRISDGQRRGKIIYMHREIMRAPSGLDVDHINGNGLDNRRGNLRLATRKQNTRSQNGLYANNTSGFIGVSFSKSNEKWEARISPNGKSIIIGYFDDKEEAARARDKAALEHFGEFASLNFPQ